MWVIMSKFLEGDRTIARTPASSKQRSAFFDVSNPNPECSISKKQNHILQTPKYAQFRESEILQRNLQILAAEFGSFASKFDLT